VSPAGIQTLIRMLHQTDVRHILASVRVPTLVLERRGDRCMRVEGARYMAERIPGARYVELPGADHFPWAGDAGAILEEVEEFPDRRADREPDRVLAPVLSRTS